MNDKNCRHLLEALSDFVDGEASEALCAEIERHLAGCDDCRVVVDTLRQTVKLYRGLPQPVLSPEARGRLYRSLDLVDYLKA